MSNNTTIKRNTIAILNAIRKEEEFLDLPIKSDKWINLIFLIDGRSHIGNFLYDTALQAKIQSDKMDCEMNDITNGKLHRIVNPITNCHMYFWHEYSHTIQIPWREK